MVVEKYKVPTLSQGGWVYRELKVFWFPERWWLELAKETGRLGNSLRENRTPWGKRRH